MKSNKWLEKYLQNQRFGLVKDKLVGDVLDFGGNKGELKKYVKGIYHLTNKSLKFHYWYFDTIVALAVIEHLTIQETIDNFKMFKRYLAPNGRIYITTPTKRVHPILKTLAFLRILDKENIEEHKHYWTKKELYQLAWTADLEVLEYRTFQMGFNQFVIMGHR